MRASKTVKLVAGLAGLTLIAAACSSGGDKAEKSPGGKAAAGGVYRTASDEFFNTGGMDPTGEYSSTGLALFPQLFVRALMGTNHVEGTAGTELIPDLAEAAPEISPDGLTYTFHIRDGVEFGPPVSRAVTSHDVEYAFERINTKSLAAQYGFYYFGVIQGMDGEAKSPEPVSGIETPNDSTIVFHLEEPTGDFVERLGLPATAPIPEEVAKCFNQAAEYGRYVISSGPYMIKGSEDLDISSCDSMKPISGFNPEKGMLIVRNPNYDPDTDSPTAREANFDGISITIDTNVDDIFNRIERGDLDGDWQGAHEPATFIQRVNSGAAEGVTIHSNPDDSVFYIAFNVLVPPFDDVHVRRAANWAMDRAALLKSVGGSVWGDVATHVFPPTVLEFPEEYDPYPSPDHGGDLEQAKAEMKQSKYDHDGDGVCDDPVCENVVMVNCESTPCPEAEPIVVDSLKQIGLDMEPRDLTNSAAYAKIQTVNELVPISIFAGWGKDYPDPITFSVIFAGEGIICEGQTNYAELGMTEDQAKECGVLEEWKAHTPPSVDADIAECQGLADQARTDCWIALDKKITYDIAAWIPWWWRHDVNTTNDDTVTKFVWDQNAGSVSLVNMAVNNKIDPDTMTF